MLARRAHWHCSAMPFVLRALDPFINMWCIRGIRAACCGGWLGVVRTHKCLIINLFGKGCIAVQFRGKECAHIARMWFLDGDSICRYRGAHYHAFVPQHLCNDTRRSHHHHCPFGTIHEMFIACAKRAGFMCLGVWWLLICCCARARGVWWRVYEYTYI